MKKYIFIASSLILITISACEPQRIVNQQLSTYIPMIVEENQWNELHINTSLPPEYQYAHTIINKIGSDTLVDGLTYHKLLTSQDEALTVWKENGLLREDTTTQKVYYKPENKPELLLYAFNVQIGDVLQTYDYNLPTTITINSIDSVSINNKMHKRIFITSTAFDEGGGNYGENNVWIEGIGGIGGLLDSYHSVFLPGGDGISLSCFYKNNELIYKPNEQEECFVWKTDFSEFWEQYNGGIIDIDSFIAALMEWIKNNLKKI